MKSPAALLLGLAWFGLAALGRAQDEPPAEIQLKANGSQLFRALLDFAGVKPAEPERDYRNKIVIVFGKPERIEQQLEIQTVTRNVLVRGGSVLFVSDKEMDLASSNQNDRGYLSNGSADIYIVPTVSVTHPTDGYKKFPECPYVTPGLIDDKGIARNKPVTTTDINPFVGMENVVTNRPGVLFLSRANPIAVFFAGFRPGTVVRHRITPDISRHYALAFAAGQTIGGSSPSRWIAIADEDVLSNSLLAAKGTDNFVFAYQLVNWLRGPEGRSECAFYEYGELKSKFDEVKFVTIPDLPGPPIPPIPPLKMIEEQLTDFGNKVADEVQSNDRIHSALVRDEVGYAKWLRMLAVAAAVVAAVFLLRRAFAARHPGSGPAVVARDDGPPGKLLAVLRQEMVRGNNFTPAVVAYIEETFRLAGLPAGPHAQMPPVTITGKKVKKVELMTDIAALWRLAFGSELKPVHYAEWRDLEPAVEHVRRLAVKGRWHFAPDVVPPGAAA